MLPEGPLAFVCKFLDVIMCYPIGIGIELRGVEVVHLELVTRIEYGLHPVLLLNNIEPGFRLAAQLFGSEVAFLLDVQDRRQVTWFQLSDGEIELRLLAGADAWYEEVVSPSDYVVSLCVGKVPVEVVIEQLLSFRCLDKLTGESPMEALRSFSQLTRS